MKKWIALFSQSGTEVVEIAKRLGRAPDLILTDRNYDNRHPDIFNMSKLLVMSHGGVEEMLKLYVNQDKTCIVTLHGYLRILSPSICDLYEYRMFNGHPGDIVTYPELKGKDPQKKALQLQLPSTGTIIHEVTSELDSGGIVDRATLDIDKDMTEEVLITKLRDLSIDLWVNLLKRRLG